MYKKILVPIDLADPDLAKPAVDTALMMAAASEGTIRFVNVLPLTPVMLAEYVPPDFEVQQRKPVSLTTMASASSAALRCCPSKSGGTYSARLPGVSCSTLATRIAPASAA